MEFPNFVRGSYILWHKQQVNLLLSATNSVTEIGLQSFNAHNLYSSKYCYQYNDRCQESLNEHAHLMIRKANENILLRLSDFPRSQRRRIG